MIFEHFSWAWFLGGLVLFYFGMVNARNGLQLLAGDKLRLAIAHLTGNRFRALSLGMLVTVILQSSTATTVILVSFAATGLLTVPQSFGVILGADIGTTLVVVLLSIKKMAEYSLGMIVVGFLWQWIIREEKLKFVGNIVFSFGLVFFGMFLMTNTTRPLAMDPVALQVFGFLAAHPVITFFAATFFTGLGQASAATIGLAMALAHAGAISLESALPMVLGANVGTTTVALAASLGSNTSGKRVAVAHLFVKAVGAAIVLPLLPQCIACIGGLNTLLTELVSFLHVGVTGEIAIFHLMFNVGLAVLFLPILPLGVWFVSKLVPESKTKEVFGPKYLDAAALETPALAFAQAKREILRIAGLTQTLYKDCLALFQPTVNFDRLVGDIQARDDQIDLLDRKVRFYLAKLSKEMLTESQGAQQMSLLAITADCEGIGDVISRELVRLARKKAERHRSFSEEGWEEIKKLHRAIAENFEITLSVLTSPHEEIIQRVIRHGEQIKEMEVELHQTHIQRLHEGQPETFETSSIHLDILANLRRINGYLMHMADASFPVPGTNKI